MFREMPIFDSRREVLVKPGSRVMIYQTQVRTICDGCNEPFADADKAIRQTVAHFDGSIRVGQAFIHYHKGCVPKAKPGRAISLS